LTWSWMREMKDIMSVIQLNELMSILDRIWFILSHIDIHFEPYWTILVSHIAVHIEPYWIPYSSIWTPYWLIQYGSNMV
jgi:hypothetical protein